MIIIKKMMKEWVLPIGIAVVVAMLINQFILFKIKVPTASMDPTIKIGDNIFATRIYNFKNIKRGDVLVFYSEELKELLVKRVIGLPGETVEVKKDNSVWIDNVELKEPYVKSKAEKFGVFKVPEGKYFFMGDNRSQSFDSRYWKEKYISTKDIKGKTQLTVYPFNRFGWLK